MHCCRECGAGTHLQPERAGVPQPPVDDDHRPSGHRHRLHVSDKWTPNEKGSEKKRRPEKGCTKGSGKRDSGKAVTRQ